MTEKTEFKSWEELILEFEYKPNFKMEYFYDIDFDEDWLIFYMKVPDVYNPNVMTTVNSKYLVARFDLLGERAALAMVRRGIQDLECHEIDEQILVRGERIFDPHKEGVRNP